MIGGNSVENEVETAGVLFHLVRIARDDDLIGSEAERVFLLVRRSREHYNVRSERMCKLHGHVTESAEPNHADLLAFGDAPVTHRGICRDPRAQQRRDTSDVQVRWNVEHELFVDDDAVGISAVGDASEVLVRKVVSESQVWAELLEIRLQFGQVRSESTMQPTAARSPGLNPVTADPTLVTRPTIS